MAAVQILAADSEDYELPPRKKPKVSELPLSSTQRSSIDGILHALKKQGEFDKLRKRVFQQYNESADRGKFENELRSFTSEEIDREPVKYLKPDRRLAAPLIEGAAARALVYDKVEDNIDVYLEQYLSSAVTKLRDIRHKEVGEEQANAELERGLKSEEAYAEEAEDRRVVRAKKFADDEKARLKKEAQDKKKKELEALKKKQEALMRETEQLQREQKRRIERDEWKKAEKEREKERIKKYNEEREKAKQEAEAREQALQVEREKKEKERQAEEQKRLEEEALQRLLREGREREERDRRPEHIDAPTRPRFSGTAPRNPYVKDEMRSHGLMPTSMGIRKDDDRRRRSRTPEDRRRESYREGTMRKESYYRDLSAEREAWKARRDKGEDGEVVERARSRSKDSHRRRERTRSPRRHRSRSPLRRRERSRSPISIDRYVPGAGRRPRESSRRRSRERREPSRERRDRSRDRRDRSRDRRQDDERRHDDDRRSRYEERSRVVDIDRYVPGTRRDRSRSRERRPERDRDDRKERDKDRH